MLSQLADTLREQQRKPQFGTTTKLTAKALGVSYWLADIHSEHLGIVSL